MVGDRSTGDTECLMGDPFSGSMTWLSSLLLPAEALRRLWVGSGLRPSLSSSESKVRFKSEEFPNDDWRDATERSDTNEAAPKDCVRGCAEGSPSSV